MPCLLAILGYFFPRLVIVLLAIFTNYLGSAFGTWVWPLLGFFFMPLTTLAYAFSIHAGGGVHDLYLILVVLAALVDLGLIGRGAHKATGRRNVRVRINGAPR